MKINFKIGASIPCYRRWPSWGLYSYFALRLSLFWLWRIKSENNVYFQSYQLMFRNLTYRLKIGISWYAPTCQNYVMFINKHEKNVRMFISIFGYLHISYLYFLVQSQGHLLFHTSPLVLQEYCNDLVSPNKQYWGTMKYLVFIISCIKNMPYALLKSWYHDAFQLFIKRLNICISNCGEYFREM